MVSSVEPVCLTSAVPRCAELLLIASSIFQEIPDFMVIVPLGVRWHVQAGHLFSVVTLESHRSEIGGVRTGVYRRGSRPLGGRTGAALLNFDGHQPKNWKSVARDIGIQRHLEPRVAVLGRWNVGTSEPRPKS